MATPPDGHWHRRTAKPIATDGHKRTYGCTERGCTWTVTVDTAQTQPTSIPTR